MAERTCPECSAPVLRDDQRFCEKCGHRLDSSEPTRTCPECSAPVLRDDQRFCEKCGHRLDSSEPTKATSGGTGWPIKVGIAVAVAAVIIAGVLLSGGSDNGDGTTQLAGTPPPTNAVPPSTTAAAPPITVASTTTTQAPSTTTTTTQAPSTTTTTTQAPSTTTTTTQAPSTTTTTQAPPSVRHEIGISMGYGHRCAVLPGGTVRCWGMGQYGQLGYGDTSNRGDDPGEMGDNLPAVDLGTGKTATAIAAGGMTSCALLSDGTVKCWGSNGSGTLGQGDTSERGDNPEEMGDNLPSIDLGSGRTATVVATDGDGACALLDDGSIKCWGGNTNGGAGYGTTGYIGREPGEMGDNLPVVDLGTGKTATGIAVGGGFTCALLNDGTIKCWGRNDRGQLGYGHTNRLGDNPGEMGDNLPVVDLGTGKTATAISSGGSDTCALLDDGTVKCWGYNKFGEFGYGHTDTLGDNPGEMGDNLPVVDLGTGKTATAISLSDWHTCALLDDDTVKCWGRNNSGQLGYGHTNTLGDNPGEMGDNLPVVDLGTGKTATAISTAINGSCAILNDGTVKCWGNSGFGELGQGHRGEFGWFTQGGQPGEMGDNLPTVDLGS
jgi:alpha-tubulin suppressor-like RCC1 family protein